jgi:hypothetical protein
VLIPFDELIWSGSGYASRHVEKEKVQVDKIVGGLHLLMKSVEFGKERKKAVDLSSQVSANVEFPFSCKLATLGTEHGCIAVWPHQV